MNWQEAIHSFGIHKIYHEAGLNNASLLPIEIVEMGKKWNKAEKKPSLFLYGNAGCGKTYLAICLFRNLILNNLTCIFVKSEKLDNELLQASLGKLSNAKGYPISEWDLFQKYGQVPYLFIDDLGSEGDSDRVRRQYYTIIDERVGNELPTIYTSNLSVEMIAKSLGERIASRLQVSYQIKFPSIDHRKTIGLPCL
jgi:DNA replication protein DnaC